MRGEQPEHRRGDNEEKHSEANPFSAERAVQYYSVRDARDDCIDEFFGSVLFDAGGFHIEFDRFGFRAVENEFFHFGDDLGRNVHMRSGVLTCIFVFGDSYARMAVFAESKFGAFSEVERRAAVGTIERFDFEIHNDFILCLETRYNWDIWKFKQGNLLM